MSHCYEHPRPALTTDCVVFGWSGDAVKVLLIERREEPFAGRWAFPGGFVEMDELLAASAARELAEETGLEGVSLEQFRTFDAVDRDPRGRTISVAHLGLVRLEDHFPKAADDARSVAWFSTADLPSLAFDHAEILQMAVTHLRRKFRHQPVGIDLLPAKFPLRRLQQLYEAVLELEFDPFDFHERMLATGVLHEAEWSGASTQEPLYSFNRVKYARLAAAGFYLDL
ncbi:NUDIX hydrolase [Candidatus Laterigemmans baculatus]|uniref:NUDIX hydrolase n=1 Tax=Candidatus Laterigemmans baculatus TaxID=2770505 RepID=UPI0013DA8FB8|nr:NUDIX domain-containing protein [Candidatus Laterigemmans baculatus]